VWVRFAYEQFNEHILPHPGGAKHVCVGKTELYRVFNSIVFRYHTGCPWAEMPVTADPKDLIKKKSVGKRSTTVSKIEPGRRALLEEPMPLPRRVGRE
jgi:hypothetical protein